MNHKPVESKTAAIPYEEYYEHMRKDDGENVGSYWDFMQYGEYGDNQVKAIKKTSKRRKE